MGSRGIALLLHCLGVAPSRVRGALLQPDAEEVLAKYTFKVYSGVQKILMVVASAIEHQRQEHVLAVYDNLPFILEVDGDLAADIRLHLPKPPLRLVRMADQHTWLQQSIQFFGQGQTPSF